jgi:large subunit ribosomal protein L21
VDLRDRSPDRAEIESITTEEKAGPDLSEAGSVVPDDVLEIGKIAGDVGTIVQLGEVLLVGGESPVLGAPTVAGASVAAEVLQHKRGPKVISFKKRRRKNSRRKRGYRDEITVLRITEILTNDNKPTIGPRPKREKPVVAAPADDDEAPVTAKKKAPARRAVAKKAAAKPRAKPDAKKAPAKKK